MQKFQIMVLFHISAILVTSCNLPNKTEEDNIVIFSPNGGEYLTANTSIEIQWSSSGGTSDIVSLYYSIDSSTTWKYIGLDRNDGSFFWYVPNTTSEKCFLKISDYLDESLMDISDKPFTITSASGVSSIMISYPNGGDTLAVGTIATIQWSYTQSESSVVTLYYSVNSGATWSHIGLDENDGSFLWYVPDYNSSECLIKIQDYSDPSVMDVSDNTFTITGGTSVGSIELIYPNGGQIFSSGGTEIILWTSSGAVSDVVSISYSVNNGGYWSTISQEVNDGSFPWLVPDQPSSQCLLKISDNSDSTNFDVSDQFFTISGSNPPSEILVTYPAGGEIFLQESIETITWIKNGDVSDVVSLFYSADNGDIWIEIGLDNNDGVYPWYIPLVASNTCLVKVQDISEESIFGESSTTFTIVSDGSSGAIQISYPNGGETFISGTSETLLWTYDVNVNSLVSIEYSSDNGVSWNNLGLSQNSGSYSWLVPDITSTLCLIKISDYNDPGINDESDGKFSIEMPGSAASDSIYYDTLEDQNVNTSYIGFGVPGEMYARMKFTPVNNFELTHVRVNYRTETSSETVILFVMSAATGSILQSVTFSGPAYLSSEGTFFLMPMTTPLTFFAGEEFYIVLSFLGVNYSVLATGTGKNGHTNRSYYSDDSINWFPLDDAIGDGGEDAWVIRALSIQEGRSVNTSREGVTVVNPGESRISLPSGLEVNRLPINDLQTIRYE